MMNPNWRKFFNIVEKRQKLIVGLMSGTSLDGLDIALCRIEGSGITTKVELLKFRTVTYDHDFKAEIKSIFSKSLADLQMIALMNEKVGLTHASMVLETLLEWEVNPTDVDLIASHGQTIFHAPKSFHSKPGFPNATLQIGDGDQIAVKTGIITICDFRQKHVAAGGEGAPLAVYGDYLLFSKKGEERILLNIGGIANFTYLSADGDAEKVFSTDVGPGNTIMDQFIQNNYAGLNFDEGGAIARLGNINNELLNALMDLDFFHAAFPKTTGPELFSLKYLDLAQARSGTTAISKEDVMTTLNRFTAQVIIDALVRCTNGDQSTAVYLSGGGAYNTVLVGHLESSLPSMSFATTDQLGVNPDAKEAVLFALLANETLAGKSVSFGNRESLPSITMGKICLPF